MNPNFLRFEDAEHEYPSLEVLMASQQSPLFMRNIQKLDEHGAVLKVRLGEKSGDQSSPSDIMLSRLNSTTAIPLAHEVTRLLDKGANKEKFTDESYHLDRSIEVADIRSKNGEPIVFESRPFDGSFYVYVGQRGFGNYSLVIDRRNGAAEDLAALQRLYEGYVEVLSAMELNLSESPEQSIPMPEDESAGIRIDLRGLTVPQERTAEVAGSIKEDIKREIEIAEGLIKLMGLEDENLSRAELEELWENRNFDPIAMIDLFLAMISRKLELTDGKDLYPENWFTDLADTARKKSSPFALRKKQEEQSIETFVSLGFSKDGVETGFQRAQTQAGLLKLRYLGWLLTQPYMGKVRSDITRYRSDGERVPTNKMAVMALGYIKNLHDEHVRLKSTAYDLTVGYDAGVYNRKRKFLKNVWLLSNYILKDMPER